eukprot:gene9288-16985_t
MERQYGSLVVKRRRRRRQSLELTKECCQCRSRVRTAKKISPKKDTRFADLPEEIILNIISYLSLKDLLSISQVSKYYHNIIDQSPVTWAKVSFQSKWPNSKSLKTFERAAESGNIECLAKLAFVSLYIYNFKAGVRKCIKTSLENATKAVNYFTRIDEIIAPELPVTWMFIRPPWAYPGGVRKCLKECMLIKIEEGCNSDEATRPALYNVGRTYLLKENTLDEKSQEFFTKAANMGCSFSKWELYKDRIAKISNDDDAGVKLENMRQLQDIASKGHFDATIELCKEYAQHQYGDANRKTAVAYFRKVMQQCSPSNVHRMTITTNSTINENMRCILVNWMHEVCDVKSIDSEALHMAVDCLDRYLLRRTVTRKQLQLIGISCVVLASKAFSNCSSSLLTIRESAWLTDSTYEYNEVVRMLAEIIGALSGQLVRMNTNHYGEIMSTLAKLDEYNKYFLNYVLDSSLQFCDFGRFKPSLIAAAATMLTNIVNGSADIWPDYMMEFTGYQVKDLANCVGLLLSRCLLDKSVVVDGEHQISGARDRYSSPKFMEVAKRPIPDLTAVRAFIEDLEPRLCCTQENNFLIFHFKEEKNVLDPIGNFSASSSFLCGYDGDEEDNQSQSTADISLLSVKDQHRPSLDDFVPEAFSEETNKYSPRESDLEYESSLGVRKIESDGCVCSPVKKGFYGSENKEIAMEKLSAVFSSACSCSAAVSSKLRNAEIRKRPPVAKGKYAIRLRSSTKKGRSTANEFDENSDRERRKRPANWPMLKGTELKGSLRPKVDRKNGSKEPWRY